MQPSQSHSVFGLVSVALLMMWAMAVSFGASPVVPLAEQEVKMELETVTLVVEGMMKSRSGAT